jgi:hypothetical protein
MGFSTVRNYRDNKNFFRFWNLAKMDAGFVKVQIRFDVNETINVYS